jgi:Golgi phosphoprotein 3
MLTLAEELFVLSLIEKRNSVDLSHNQALPYALAGAMMFELIQSGTVRIEEDKKVRLIDASLVEDGNYTELIEKIQQAKTPKKLTYWIGLVGSKGKKLQKSLFDRLLANEILLEQDKRFVWVVSSSETSQPNASEKYRSKLHLRALALGGEKVDERGISLLTLLRTCYMLNYVFTNDEIKIAHKRVDELIRDKSLNQEVVDLLSDISAAIGSAALAAGI